MELGINNVVVTRNGKVGVVDSVFGVPCVVVFPNFTMNVSRFKGDLKNSNNAYDIVKVLDGNDVPKEDIKKFFRSGYNISGLKVLWEEGK